MSEEEKIVVENSENQCNCCKCCETVKEILSRAVAVFLGVLLALITAHALFAPKCPCAKGMPYQRMGVERQIPHHFKEVQNGREHFDKRLKRGHMGPNRDFQKPVEKQIKGE